MSIITFVCVNFNNSTYTEKLCRSLDSQICKEVKFSIRCIVVDNSTDNQDAGRLERYSGTLDWVEYIRSPENLGYFGGLNLGLRKVADKVSQYVVICNNDLTFETSFCLKLIAKKYADNIFVICPDLVTADGIHQNPHRLNRVSSFQKMKLDLYFSNYYVALLSLFAKRLMSNTALRSSPNRHMLYPKEINQGIGACYILTASFFRFCGELYFPWFLYGEEACLSWQVHSMGGILWFDPDLHAIHAEHATLSTLPRRATYEWGRTSYWGFRHLL
jgi:GT2 family glycosyltransferase